MRFFGKILMKHDLYKKIKFLLITQYFIYTLTIINATITVNIIWFIFTVKV